MTITPDIISTTLALITVFTVLAGIVATWTKQKEQGRVMELALSELKEEAEKTKSKQERRDRDQDAKIDGVLSVTNDLKLSMVEFNGKLDTVLAVLQERDKKD